MEKKKKFDFAEMVAAANRADAAIEADKKAKETIGTMVGNAVGGTISSLRSFLTPKAVEPKANADPSLGNTVNKMLGTEDLLELKTRQALGEEKKPKR